jgi:hypothetical protein
MSKEEFYHSTINDLLDYNEAYRLKRKMEDEKALYLGHYFYEAVSVAISNAFSKKGSKPIQYRTKGIIQEIEDRNRPLTEVEKIEQTNNLFAMLDGMQARFEASKSGGE